MAEANRQLTWQERFSGRQAVRQEKPARLSPRALGGARARLSEEAGVGTPYDALWGLATQPDREVDWRALNLDRATLDRIGTADLVHLMADVSPEISGALWHFIRFCNPGWEAVALRPGTEKMDVKAQARLGDFLDLLGQTYGAVDVVWNMLFVTGFLRGAFFAELVADDRGRLPVDLVAVDPHAARYRRHKDPLRGEVWQLGQMVNNTWIPLDVATIGYVPVDPLPGGAPYGRSLVTPAVFSALFLLSLLHDLRRVVAQQGYPRLDLEVRLEELINSMPDEFEQDANKQQGWVKAVIDEVAAVYGQLEPDDAYVHTDIVKVNRPVGAVDASSLGAVDSLIRAVERMATRGLKTMPLLMGSNEAVSETHANRQWEIHVAGVKALQHLAEQLLERLLTLALEMQGIQAVVRFRFAELRASEQFRDAQTEAMRIANARAKYEAGWVGQNEAAQEVTGHPADAPAPRVSAAGANQASADLGPAEGEERVRANAPASEDAWKRPLLDEMEQSRQSLERLLDVLVVHAEMVDARDRQIVQEYQERHR